MMDLIERNFDRFVLANGSNDNRHVTIICLAVISNEASGLFLGSQIGLLVGICCVKS